jgi:hypothetical protein
MELLIMLARDHARVARVAIPEKLDAASPATQARVLEQQLGRPVRRALALDRPARVLEARADGVTIKRYLVGVGNALSLAPGGMYALDRGFAYVVDPAQGGIALRDQDAREVLEYIGDAPPRLFVTG